MPYRSCRADNRRNGETTAAFHPEEEGDASEHATDQVEGYQHHFRGQQHPAGVDCDRRFTVEATTKIPEIPDSQLLAPGPQHSPLDHVVCSPVTEVAEDADPGGFQGPITCQEHPRTFYHVERREVKRWSLREEQNLVFAWGLGANDEQLAGLLPGHTEMGITKKIEHLKRAKRVMFDEKDGIWRLA